MTATTSESLVALYLIDETAWLEEMAELIAHGEFGQLDYDNLREYLTDMAIRDRREMVSRLIVLIFHHLKCQYQPQHKTRSWRLTIAEQRRELQEIFDSKTLRKHAESRLSQAYSAAVEQAAIETGLPISAFPAKSKLSASEWVALPVPD